MNMLVGLMEKGMLPDAVIRRGIIRLLRKRLQDEYHGDTEVERQWQSEFLATLQSCPVAIETAAANDQHYELPPAFFAQVLG